MRLLNTSKLAVAALAALVLTACGGGGGDSVAVVNSPSSFMVESGLAQKGPLMQGSQITINELAFSTFQPSGRSFDFEVTNNLGTFDPSGIKFSSPYLSTTAEGYYFNEITGLPSADTVFLRGLSDLYTGEDTTINVNVLSNFSKNRILNLATGKNLLNPVTGAAVTPAPIKFLKARAQAQSENLNAFYIYNSANILSGTTVGGVAQPANFTALDLSKKRAGDQILAAMSAVVMTAGTDGNGVNTLLSQIEADFAHDGLLNNSPKYARSVQSRLCAAAASTDFAKVATNLNNFYGTNYQATDLSQWVDTSGCVDQVINKYKFSASDVAVGTVSRSPAYKVGADDVGQCFSVGGVTTGATAGLYYNGAAMAVVGTKLVKAGDSVAIGINASTAGTYSGFIQRSAPATNGTCPAVVPLNGLTKVEKYTTNSGYTVGGTVTGLASGQTVTLLNNGGNALIVSGNGTFNFTNTLASGTAYVVTVGTQPSGQKCTVENGSGTVLNNVQNISVTCTTATFKISGTVSGLSNGKKVILLKNGSDALTVSGNGNFSFADSLMGGANYMVTVFSGAPDDTTCIVSNGTGIGTSDVSNVRVACDGVQPQYPQDWALRLFLVEGSLVNGSTINSQFNEINVKAGANISGQVRLKSTNARSGGDVVPVIYQPSWGPRQTSFSTITSWVGTGSQELSVNLNLSAPSATGTYFIYFASSAEIKSAGVASSHNHAAGTVIWNDGNDIVDLNLSELQIAQSRIFGFAVINNYLLPAGAKPVMVGLSFIKVNVLP